jgi:hypothetical protein
MDAPLAGPNAYARATETAQYVRSKLPAELQNPKVAIVCGSGLGGLAETIEAEPKVELSYGDIPHFPQSTGMFCSREVYMGGKRLIHYDSGGPCWKVCLWSDWASEDDCCTFGWTGTVSNEKNLLYDDSCIDIVQFLRRT